ncbi:UbiA prenyltransferase family protein [Candidatus Woesearchaeota archaeon]|nr:UbiA prenyltransferase family protein [Candidatus Woesearchaeota archaeon]MBW3016585.1 UbiA prenyltransferase family protein [Candidatus Woesearchaeota archaeon]
MKYLKLLRPKQWYKNLLVFLPLIFSGNLLNTTAIKLSITAFISFCALSSATYVINDYADRKKDRLHPEKHNRPIASGKVGKIEALLIIILLTTIGFGTALLLPTNFLYAALGYFILSQLYTAWLKHEAFADILTISVNFVIRAVAGALAITVWVSPWLILGVFFLALFLVLGKRRSEIMLLKEKTHLRKTLKAYTPELTSRLSALATTTLVITYTLYVFFGQHQLLYLTLPPALYAVFRYENIISTGNKIAREPEKVFTDIRMMAAMIIWGVLTITILYL